MSYLSKILIKFKGITKEQIFSLITLVIPINIYIIGNFLGAGLQTPLFRFQITGYGSFFYSCNAGFILYYFRNLQWPDCVVNIVLGHRSMFLDIHHFNAIS